MDCITSLRQCLPCGQGRNSKNPSRGHSSSSVFGSSSIHKNEKGQVCVTDDWSGCETCAALSKLDQTHKKKTSVHELTKYGCSFCTAILEGIRIHGYALPPEREINLERVLLYSGKLTRPPLHVSFKDQDTEILLTFYVTKGHGRNLDMDCNLGTVIDFTRERLDHCLKNHTTCGPDTPSIPDRILELETDCDLSDKQVFEDAVMERKVPEIRVRLRERHELLLPPDSSQLDYACLSYCWGDELPLQTKTSNIAAMRAEIPFSSLPRTFREAVLMSLALGLKYVWIDALCIIQDDRNDWLTQAGRMGELFESAKVTFAASMAGNCHDGFIRPPVRTWEPQREIACVWAPTQTEFTMYCRRWLGPVNDGHITYLYSSAFGMYEGSYKQDFVTPLSTRGWAFQESALSARMIKFEPSESEWECNESMSCECYEGLGFLSTPKGLLRYMKGSEELQGFPGLWPYFMAYYFIRDLTFSTDRLIAISGVARKVSKGTGAKYYAGHWDKNLLETLDWKLKSAEGRTLESKRGKYIAPSWSIAAPQPSRAVDLTPLGDRKNLTLLADLVEVTCDASEEDGTGQVTSGVLRLRTTVSQATTGTQTERYALPIEGLLPSEITDKLIITRCRLEPDMQLENVETPRTISCVWISSEQNNQETRIRLLACQEVPGRDVLERIGLIEFFYTHMSNAEADRAELRDNLLAVLPGEQEVAII